MFIPTHVVADRRGGLMMFCNPLRELSLRLPNVGGTAVCTLDLVHQACLVPLLDLILEMYKVSPDGIKWAQVDRHSCLVDGAINGL